MSLVPTRHAELRIAQRLSRASDFALICEYGDLRNDGQIVTDQSIARICGEIAELRLKEDRLRRLRGVHVPLTEDGRARTVERTCSRKRKRILRGALPRRR